MGAIRGPVAFLSGMIAAFLVCAVMVKIAPPVVTVAAPVLGKSQIHGDSIAVYHDGRAYVWSGRDEKGQLRVIRAIEYTRAWTQ